MAEELSNATRVVLEVIQANRDLPQSEALINTGEGLLRRLCVYIATNPQAISNTIDVVRRLPDLINDFADWYDRLRTSLRNLKRTICEGGQGRRRSSPGFARRGNGVVNQRSGGLSMRRFDHCREAGSEGAAKLGPVKSKKPSLKKLQEFEKALRKLKAALPESDVSVRKK